MITLHFTPRYGLAALIIFGVLVLIAAFVRDDVIRPLGGDLLVVGFLYALVRATTAANKAGAAIAVVAFAFVVEGLQAVDVIERLGLEHTLATRLILGSVFDWRDLVMYALGGLASFAVDRGAVR